MYVAMGVRVRANTVSKRHDTVVSCRSWCHVGRKCAGGVMSNVIKATSEDGGLHLLQSTSGLRSAVFTEKYVINGEAQEEI